MMGGVVGAVSGKFVLVAATLLLHAKVDRTSVEAVIDPGAATSSISRQSAERLHLSRRAGRGVTIGIGAETISVPPLAVADDAPGQPALRIGRDVLAGHVLAIDFRSRTIRIVLPSEYRRFTGRLDAVPLRHGPSGSLEATAQVGGAPPMPATVDLGDTAAVRVSAAFARSHLPPADGAAADRQALVLGDAPLPDAAVLVADSGASPPVTIGLPAFAHSSIVLDLPHDRIWVRTARGPAA